MSVFSQVTAGELHKYIFKTRLPRAQVFELISVFGHRIQERRNREVRLANA
jgi:hypothetical protein